LPLTKLHDCCYVTQIDWDYRTLFDNGSQCKVTVDGTDFRIKEPQPFDPKWLSEKFNGPGVKYEVAVCIQTGWIVHVNGPYPCGAWHDLTVARDSLCYKLAASEFEGEMALADGGYQDGYQFFETPTGHNTPDQKMKADARARHETVNRRFKMWNVLGERFRADAALHGTFFHAVANLTQFLIMASGFALDGGVGRPLIHVDYNDNGGTNQSTNHIPMIGDDSDEE
jgi:DDE superfamily endonuclease